ncbi:MAG: SGNH/GDSL hydrolase family protein [Bacillota bacterium]
MEFNNMQFFNIVEVEKNEYGSGLKLHRFPENVRNNLGRNKSSFGRHVARFTTGCEIRFVSEGDTFAISLKAVAGDGEILIYQGDFFQGRYKLRKGIIETFKINENPQMKKVNPEVLNKGSFSPAVWRIVFCHDFICEFAGIESYGYQLRAPLFDEVPTKRWLAYGSSITHGANANLQSNSYLRQAARKLRVDILNKGMGGSCFCEKEMADFIAKDVKWDFITLELGVNMRGGFSSKEFDESVQYFIDKIQKENPQKPIILLTIFPNYADYINKGDDVNINQKFNEILRKIYKKYNNEFLHLIEGEQILNQFYDLSCDLIHPSPEGHINMGRNLSAALEKILSV